MTLPNLPKTDRLAMGSSSSRKIRTRLKVFLGVTGLALLDTVYLTYLHYKPGASTVCKINDYLDCDIVNKSIYAELLGIPVAVLGLLTYLLLFALGWVVLGGARLTRFWKALRPSTILWFMFGVTAFGVLFSGYLTYVELFVLYAVCLFCLLQQILIIVDLFLLLSILSLVDEGKRKNPDVCEFC